MPFSGSYVSLFLYAIVVLALLIAELRENARAQYLFKPLAALGFVLLALQFGAFESDFGRLILLGLVFCYLGDVLLLSRSSDALLRSGMAAFGAGHILFILAIYTLPPAGYALGQHILIGAICLAAGFLIFRSLKADMPKDMVWPVLIYVMIIMGMLWRACLIEPSLWTGLVIPAALMFAISDCFVGRDRFVNPDPKNFLAITPLYFGAQALFALSVSI